MNRGEGGEMSREEREMDEGFMLRAIEVAKRAGAALDVPVGAIIVREGRIIARGWNRREATKDSTAHAEIEAIRKASRKLGRWNLSDCDLYVTLEPCAMCAGAIVNSRIRRVVYGASDIRFGCGGSLMNLLSDCGLNHSAKITKGCREEECRELLTAFFKGLRRGGQ